jgi:hypothetical protein
MDGVVRKAIFQGGVVPPAKGSHGSDCFPGVVSFAGDCFFRFLREEVEKGGLHLPSSALAKGIGEENPGVGVPICLHTIFPAVRDLALIIR